MNSLKAIKLIKTLDGEKLRKIYRSIKCTELVITY